MSFLADFFRNPIVFRPQAGLKQPSFMSTRQAGQAQGRDSDLNKLSLDPGFFRKMANVQRDLNQLKKKQKSDPNSKSLAAIIQKKEVELDQLNKVSEKRNEAVYGSLKKIFETQLGYFHSVA